MLPSEIELIWHGVGSVDSQMVRGLDSVVETLCQDACLLIGCSAHSTCGVLCTVWWVCAATLTFKLLLLPNLSLVKKIRNCHRREKSSARPIVILFNFFYSSSKSVNTGAIN